MAVEASVARLRLVDQEDDLALTLLADKWLRKRILAWLPGLAWRGILYEDVPGALIPLVGRRVAELRSHEPAVAADLEKLVFAWDSPALDQYLLGELLSDQVVVEAPGRRTRGGSYGSAPAGRRGVLALLSCPGSRWG